MPSPNIYVSLLISTNRFEVIFLLNVLSPKEAHQLINEKFAGLYTGSQTVPLSKAIGRILAQPIVSEEYLPGFDRSSVDGYAVLSKDTFGCSASIPAILQQKGEVIMGAAPKEKVTASFCIAISTGGALPEGADAVVMIEDTEDYNDGTIGIIKPIAPGANMIFKGDDLRPREPVLPAGRLLLAHDIGALAALGYSKIDVVKAPLVGIISTGNELVDINTVPQTGQVRDINTWLLLAAVSQAGGKAKTYGIIADKKTALIETVDQAARECDLIIISGGSSVGAKDFTLKAIQELGEVYLHGISVKPGKPTIMGAINNKPIFGLPGHPVAAHFIFESYVHPLLMQMMGTSYAPQTVNAILGEPIPSNHGKEESLPIKLVEEDNQLIAYPIRGKSGLITTLLATNGFLRVPRDCEGIAKDTSVEIILYAPNFQEA